MALSIKSAEVERKVRKLAAVTGKSITAVVCLAVDEQLKREERRRLVENETRLAEIRAIAHHCASLPVLDDRSEDEIMGWDENGLPS
jgi:antitoxin VapB